MPSKYDSILLQILHSQETTEANAVLMNEQTAETNSVPVTVLAGEKDVFLQMAAFQFSTMRYRYRGYDASVSGVLINGLLLNDLHRGNPPWSMWNGLSQVMRNSIDYTVNRFQDHWLGDAGITHSTDMRGIAQKKQLQWGYALSNRTYEKRYHVSHATEMNQKGWSWAWAANVQTAAEGYRTGCAYFSGSYYAAADKQFKNAGLLSVIVFGSAQQYGKQAAVTSHATDLLGTTYNPNWGYQQGRKRNAAIAGQHLPTAVLSYEYNPDNHTTWFISIGTVMGEKTDSGLDWYQAPDPRPDYYRYLPAYQTDSLLQSQVTGAWIENKDLQQINWQQLYTINRNAFEKIENVNGTGAVVAGRRSHYLIEQRVTNTNRWLLSGRYQTRLKNNFNISTGFHFSHQQNHYFKKIQDLLGADFHVNWNQFAEADFPVNTNAIQFDIDIPNRILRKGDRYGYNYLASIITTNFWAEAEYPAKKIDYLFGIRFTKTEFNRKGLVRNGLFPDHSKGTALADHFFNPLVKTGITLKLHAKHLLGFLVQLQTSAPLFDQVYIAPKMRNTKQENATSETMVHIETNYRLLLHKLSIRTTAYHTKLGNGMNVLSFYHDGYKNFVNYAIQNINRQYMGIESALSWQLGEKWEWTLAFSKAQNIYTSRQTVTVSLDNNDALLGKTVVYVKHFKIGGSPQQLAGTGIRYHTQKSFFIQVNANFFNDRWLDFNPLRRTYEALEGIQKGSEQWNAIIGQTKLPSVYLMNVFLGKGFSISNGYPKKPVRFFFCCEYQ